ncbi:hypothetical protein ABVK25_010969 [Lepraria finkii]|uniref:Uncharacterized protein n=1 Tax=Lepraria finkii TaxID=1340010 RepID=A0ABR4ASV6_9LECA
MLSILDHLQALLTEFSPRICYLQFSNKTDALTSITNISATRTKPAPLFKYCQRLYYTLLSLLVDSGFQSQTNYYSTLDSSTILQGIAPIPHEAVRAETLSRNLSESKNS